MREDEIREVFDALKDTRGKDERRTGEHTRGRRRSREKKRKKKEGKTSSDDAQTYFSGVTEKSERLLTKYLEASAAATAVAAVGTQKDGGAFVL